MIEFIKQWIEDNHLDAKWIDGMSFIIDDKKYLFIKHKKGKIFNEEFDLLVDNEESEAALLADKSFDYYCFQFGDKVYYSPRLQDKIQLNILRYQGKAKDVVGIPYLGVHGGYELCNGSRVYDDWCKKASFLGITHLAICERNTLAGVLKFQITCKKHNIIPIIGMSAVVKRDDGDRYQAKIFVCNSEGWQSLLLINRLINVENSERYIEEQQLVLGHLGIIIVIGEVLLTQQIVDQYKDIDRVYFQIDPAQFKSVERDKKKLEVYKQYLRHYRDKISPVVICDSYYLEQQDHHIKKILNTIGNIGFDHQSEDQFFKSADVVIDQLQQMFTTFEGKDQLIDNALDNIYKVIDQCNFSIELGKLKLPQYKMTEQESSLYETNLDLLYGLLQKGLEEKVISKRKDVDVFLQRIETEIKVIEKSGVVDYFLILADIISWCKNNDVLTGIGRGSAAGSAVAYLLDLTKLDPIQYDLLFERFLNEGRAGKSLPDIDTDLPTSRRDEVKRYVEERYGVDNVCSIGTYGTFKIKAALKDLCRIKGIPPQTVNYFSSMLTDGEDDFHSLFYDASKAVALKKFISENVDVISDIPLVLSQPKNASMHAAGVVITPTYSGEETIYNWMPVKKMGEILVSEWEGPELEAAGYLKEDILGIKQLDKFNDILKYVKQNYNQEIEFENIDYNDQEVYKLFQKGYNQDLFHFGSVGLTSYSQEVKPESIEELIAMIALYRPGAMESRAHEDYVKIKFGRKQPQYDYMLEDITKSTYGLYIYQEQVMKACQVLGGVTLVEADDIRKAMGKKDLEKLQSFKAKFISNAIRNGCREIEANKIWNKLEMFAEYGFNRCISGKERILRVGNNLTGKSTFRPTIEDMYQIKNNKEYAKRIGKLPLYKRYNAFGYGMGFSLNQEGRLIRNHIKDIRYEGVRNIYRITLQSGIYIDTTTNHTFPTPNGKRRLDELTTEHWLYVNSGYEHSDNSFRFGRDENHNYPVAGQQGFQKKDTSCTRHHILKEESRKINYCESCGKGSCRLELHHKDGDHGNNVIDNTIVLCSSCHKKAEYKLGRVKMGEKGLLTKLERIISIELIGSEKVYDVEMAAPNHTFTTDKGIVTCNSHAAAYAMTGYFCQYLKCYYPMEFWTVSLQYADEDEIPQRIGEIRKLQHITILPPDINNSQKQFTSDFDTNTIYWSLSKIKFAGEGSIDTIIKEREINGKFFSIEEFYSRVPKRTVNKRVVVNLILSGCFDQLYNVEVIEQRRELLKQFYELIGEELPDEYNTNSEFFWFLQQKQISGSGYFDYSKLISNSEIPKIDIKYLTPDRVLLSDNVDCEGVVIGMLVDVIQKNSKKGQFAQLILDHNNEVIEVTLWSEKWEEYKIILEDSKDKVIIVSGKVTKDRYKKHNIIHSTNDSIVEII